MWFSEIGGLFRLSSLYSVGSHLPHRYLAAVPAMSLAPVAPFEFRISNSRLRHWLRRAKGGSGRNGVFRRSSLLSLFAPLARRSPRRRRLLNFSTHLLHFWRRHRAEEYPHRLFPPNYAHQFVHHAIRGDEDEENDLDGEEMRPDDFRQQLLIAGDKAARLAPEIDQAFQIVNDSRKQQVDNGLPGDVVDQRFVRKTIDHRQHVCD